MLVRQVLSSRVLHLVAWRLMDLRFEHEILWFDISMNDARSVDSFQPSQHLVNDQQYGHHAERYRGGSSGFAWVSSARRNRF